MSDDVRPGLKVFSRKGRAMRFLWPMYAACARLHDVPAKNLNPDYAVSDYILAFVATNCPIGHAYRTEVLSACTVTGSDNYPAFRARVEAWWRQRLAQRVREYRRLQREAAA